jgi:amino acid adenylation domain-containing protein
MSDLSERIAGLSQEKRDLFKRLLAQKGVTLSRLPIVPRKKTTDPLPLSFAQQRLWFLDQLEPSTSSYNIFDTLTFTGPLDTTALASALNEIVRRHEVLRTCFETLSGQPVQIVSASLSLSLPVIDLSELESIEQEAEVSRHSTAEAQRPFNLSRCPLLRATLLRLSNEHHLLLLTMHHIISDGWSLGIFNTELQTLYAAYAAGQQSPLPELSVQYADFALWQREWLRGEVLEEQLSYWKRQLAGAPAVLELPVDRARPAVQTSKGASQTRALPRGLSESLKSYSQREGVTLFMTLVSGFKALLYRYTGQSEIVIGTPIANRTRAELEGLIGFFVNTLVLRTRMEAEESFSGLVKRVREVALGAYAHQDVPFEKLVMELQPERDMSRNPMFQVTFQLSVETDSIEDASEALEREHEEFSDEGESETEVVKGAAKFDLAFNVWEGRRGLRVQVDYNTDLFEDATISRMMSHFQSVLEGAVADPARPVSRLPLLTDKEQHGLLLELNQTTADYPRDKCVHELFEAQARRAPESVAVVFADEQLTYAELNERANQLARRLRVLGVGPDVMVGICMERSIEMLVAMLGILKAGGAYLPLDPEYPAERLAFMIEDAGVYVLLTQERLAKSLPDYNLEVIRLDTDWKEIAVESKDDLENRTTPENLAYVIYTSGSTGKPKGVCIPHRAVARLICNVNYIDLKADDVIAQASNASFDAATFEIWGALLNGAKLVGIGREVALLPDRLAGQIRDLKISVLFLTTALFKQVAGEMPDAFGSVRYLLFGGENADAGAVRAVLGSKRPQHLLHLYGPTESTTFATWSLLDDLAADASIVPIGRALTNTQIYILDGHLQPVPVGVSGELYIGGEGLARGYLHRPELTAEKFIPHPFSRQPGARLYRTGDVARYRLDGEIEFLGRRDEQVKMRGYRIELGEIESVLREHPSVREAVVLVREDAAGEKRLAAYVVLASGSNVSASELRGYLREKVPEYMVASFIVPLDALPITPNGKLDRHALAALNPESATEQENAYVAPRTQVEKALVEIYSTVLNLKAVVGVQDNFFDLGGHSLLATQIISRIRDAFHVELPLRSLFANPFVAGLAEEIEEARKKGKTLGSPAIIRASREQYRARFSPQGMLEIPEALKRISTQDNGHQ